MRILIIGAGVVGTVYGAHLGACGHTVSVLAHGARTALIADRGLQARDMFTDQVVDASVRVVTDAAVGRYDLVLVCVRRDQIAGTAATLTILTGSPTVLWFGNNPAGRNGIPDGHAGYALLGFPGIGGTLNRTVADYVRIAQQPTALPHIADPSLDEFSRCLHDRGFAVQRVDDMDGWLMYHAAFVACIAAALGRCDTDPARLGSDRATLSLMCAAITDAFRELRHQRVGGRPRNLAVLHHRLLRPVAIRYWAATMRSPMGEQCFAAHTRHASAEMDRLAEDIRTRIPDTPAAAALHTLLGLSR